MNNNLPQIFALAPINWHFPWWTDRQHLLSRLAARGWPIVFSSGPLSLWERESHEWMHSSIFGRAERFETGDNRPPLLIDHPGKVLPLWPKFPKWDQVVRRRHARRLQLIAGNNNEAGRIAFICYPSFLPYVDLLDARWVVLHINDAWNTFSDWNDELSNNFSKLAERADLITCIAGSMARSLTVDGLEKVKIIHHGVDADAIIAGHAAPCPTDIKDIPHPRIGYLGRITQKVDLGLVHKIASQHPDWHWVMIGTIAGIRDASPSGQDLRKCLSLPNIHFIGRKDQIDLPAYLCHMDVNTLCYKVDETGFWTSGFPLKLFEYLASGKPVIGSDIENIKPYADVIDIAKTPEAWIESIKHALMYGGVGTPERRKQVAYENTWEKRTDDMEHHLMDMIKTCANHTGSAAK